MLEEMPFNRARRLPRMTAQQGQNDNTPEEDQVFAHELETYGRLRIESDGHVHDFIVPADDEIELMALISEIAGSAEKEEAATESRRIYIIICMLAFLSISILGAAIFWF